MPDEKDRKTEPKVYFVRIKADIYKDIDVLAKEDERSISYMVNKLLEQSLSTNSSN